MFNLSNDILENLIKEDVPYLDLTTFSLGIGKKSGKIEFFSREEAILASSEEAKNIAQKLNLEVLEMLPSGSQVVPQQVFFSAQGEAEDLHKAWKVCLNLFEYCSGIATRTNRLVTKAKEVNPHIAVVTTRKVFPGTKALAVKAVLAGGGWPHRLGLSETILVFKQHLNFMAEQDLPAIFKNLQVNACEKKIIVEAEKLEEAEKFVELGVDGIQFDKVEPQNLTGMVKKLREIKPNLTILAAGGINKDNVAAYAKTGINALVTTSPYFGKPIDMTAKITAL